MTPLTVIAARSKNHVIGREGALAWHVPEDMAFFREQTMGYPCIMGRRTWESRLGRPLDGRLNIVISRTKVDHPMVYTFPTLNDAHMFVTMGQRAEAAWVIGGEQLYKEAMSIAQELVLTEFDFEVAGDTYFEFPQLDDGRTWHLFEQLGQTSERSITHPQCHMTFKRYVRRGI